MLITLRYIAFFLIGSYETFKTDKKNHSLSKNVFIALFAGIAVSLFLSLIAPDSRKIIIEWYCLTSHYFINLLKRVATPLFLISILPAINMLKNSTGFGRISSIITDRLLTPGDEITIQQNDSVHL